MKKRKINKPIIELEKWCLETPNYVLTCPQLDSYVSQDFYPMEDYAVLKNAKFRQIDMWDSIECQDLSFSIKFIHVKQLIPASFLRLGNLINLSIDNGGFLFTHNEFEQKVLLNQEDWLHFRVSCRGGRFELNLDGLIMHFETKFQNLQWELGFEEYGNEFYLKELFIC
jgi:hypothetical protein